MRTGATSSHLFPWKNAVIQARDYVTGLIAAARTGGGSNVNLYIGTGGAIPPLMDS
jgi:hypothetical protein